MELITITRREGLSFDIRLREHRLVTDLSEREGGHDQGCNPVELLAASVGGCLAIMTQRFCCEHGCTDGDVAVSVTTELAKDPSRVAGFVVDVELPAGVPPEVQAELERLVTRFPVPATLHAQPRLDVDFSAAAAAVLHRG